MKPVVQAELGKKTPNNDSIEEDDIPSGGDGSDNYDDDDFDDKPA